MFVTVSMRSVILHVPISQCYLSFFFLPAGLQPRYLWPRRRAMFSLTTSRPSEQHLLSGRKCCTPGKCAVVYKLYHLLCHQPSVAG